MIKVSIIGPESSGKSTLGVYLSRVLECSLILEYARELTLLLLDLIKHLILLMVTILVRSSTHPIIFQNDDGDVNFFIPSIKFSSLSKHEIALSVSSSSIV